MINPICSLVVLIINPMLLLVDRRWFSFVGCVDYQFALLLVVCCSMWFTVVGCTVHQSNVVASCSLFIVLIINQL